MLHSTKQHFGISDSEVSLEHSRQYIRDFEEMETGWTLNAARLYILLLTQWQC